MAKASTKKPSGASSSAGKKKKPKKDALAKFKGNFDLQADLKKDGSAIVSFIVASGASKSVAVNSAVTNQLYRDGRWPPNDLTKVMNAPPYRYGTASMRNFLDGVAQTLAAGLPPYKFAWNGDFVQKALPCTVAALMAEIEMATS